MARTDTGTTDFARISSKETDNQRSLGTSDQGPRRLPGLATPRSNPRQSGGGINRSKKKSGLQ